MRIPVMKIFKLSLKDAWEHKLEWLRVAFAPLVVWAVATFFMGLVFWVIGHPLSPHQALFGQIPLINMDNLPPLNILVSGGLAKLVYEFAYWVAILSLMINAFRYGVLREGGKEWWTLHLNKRLGKLLLYTFFILVSFGLYTAIGTGVVIGIHYLVASTALDIVLGALFSLCGFYILIRLSLLNLLIAIDRSHPISTSWHLLKGNVLRLVGLSFLIMLVLSAMFLGGMIALYLVGILLEWISPAAILGVEVLVICFGLLMWFAFWVVWIKALSLAYQTLEEGKAL